MRIYIYISVAKPYGRFGQKLESLHAGHGARSKADRAKSEQGVGKKQGRA